MTAITGHPYTPPCVPAPDAYFTRMIATGWLVPSQDVISDEFVMINAKGWYLLR